jgi:hypothetical protein
MHLLTRGRGRDDTYGAALLGKNERVDTEVLTNKAMACLAVVARIGDEMVEPKLRSGGRGEGHEIAEID